MTKKLKDLEKIFAEANLSGYAENLIGSFIDEQRFTKKDEFDDEELLNWIYCSEEFIYYSHAFNYLMDENITDFREAIQDGCTDVSQIAEWHLRQECFEKIFIEL